MQALLLITSSQNWTNHRQCSSSLGGGGGGGGGISATIHGTCQTTYPFRCVLLEGFTEFLLFGGGGGGGGGIFTIGHHCTCTHTLSRAQKHALKRTASLDSALNNRTPSPVSSLPASLQRFTGGSDVHVCVLCLKALMNNAVSHMIDGVGHMINAVGHMISAVGHMIDVLGHRSM